MNAFAQKEGLPGMGYILWREEDLPREATIDPSHPLFRVWHAQRNELALKSPNLLTQEQSDFLDRPFPQSIEQWPFASFTFFAGAGPLAKNIGPVRTEAIRQQLGLGVGDAAFFLGGKPETFEAVAGRARTEIGRELGLTEKDCFRFAWIVDFPMYEKTDDGKIDFSHNPFSMPQGGMEALNGDPLAVYAYQYDLACNGYELISGGIRNHKPEIMFKAFELAGYPASEVEKRFGGMVKAFRYGAPPHGGCAAGIDRIVMLLADEANIREVIMFPMNQQACDLLMGAPSEPLTRQLRELNLRVVPKE